MNSYFFELAIHTPLCVIQEPKRVLIVSDHPAELALAELAKHTSAPEAVVSREPNGVFDIIYDLRTAQPETRLNEALTPHGIVIKAFSVLNHQLISMYSAFRYVAPFGFSSLAPAQHAPITGFLFASRRFHPTADLLLQKADMLEPLEYYSVDIHHAAFALPPALAYTFGNALKL